MKESAFILTFRDEFFPEPKQLVAFRDKDEANKVRDDLSQVYQELKSGSVDQDEANKLWAAALLAGGVPEDKYFKVDVLRYSNAVFQVKELGLVGEKAATSIVLLSGPPGSGKSTIAQQLAQTYEKCVYLSVDELRLKMVKGIFLPEEYPNTTRNADGVSFPEESIEQFRLARESACFTANLYARAGVNVVIDDVCDPYVFKKHYNNLAGQHLVKVLLLPSQEKLIDRIIQRGGPWDEILVRYLPEIYEFLEPLDKTGWVVLDTSDLTVEETFEQVKSSVQ